MCEAHFFNGAHQHQRGAVLIVGLIMLLLMTIIGLSSIRGSNLQELMAGNMRDRQVSFQAAEAGLRAGEISVNGASPPDIGGAVGFVKVLEDGGAADFWFVYNWSTQSVETNLDLLIEEESPRFVVEQLDVAAIPGADGGAIDVLALERSPDLVFYRITSRGVGMTSNTETFVQSLFRRQ